MTAAGKRKSNNVDNGPCLKKRCKDTAAEHNKCNSASQQKAHKKSHDLHRGCVSAAAEQRRRINELKADNATLTKGMQTLSAEYKVATDTLLREVAEAKQQADKVKALPNTFSVADFGSVITQFADNAKKLYPAPMSSTPVPPTSGKTTYSIDELAQLRTVLN